MQISSVILGPVVTEKAERQRAANTYVLRVHLDATKIDVKQALHTFFDVEVESIRVLRVAPKVRLLGAGKSMEKRHRSKRMIVRLSKKSKPLDLTQFLAS